MKERFKDIRIITSNGRYWDEKEDKLIKAGLADLLDYAAYCMHYLTMAMDVYNSTWNKTEQGLIDQWFQVSYWSENLAMVNRLIDCGLYREVNNYGDL